MRLRNLSKIFIRKNTLNLMYLPALTLFFLFVFFPYLKGFSISLTNWNGFSQQKNFVGFENYLSFFTDKNILTAFKNTLFYGFGSTFFQQILGLSYALLLNQKFPLRNITRITVYLSVLIAPVIMSYIWYFIFQYDGGALNDLVYALGLEEKDWLGTGKNVTKIIVFINTLQFTGISMVIFLAGLKNIPKMYYEASQMDGAGNFFQFSYITLPLLSPAIITSITINLIGGLKIFDQIYALVGGNRYSSHSFSTLINFVYFHNQQAGYAAVIGVMLFLLILFVSLLILHFLKKLEVEYK